MKFKSILKIGFAVTFLLTSTSLFAQDPQVPCPSIDLVKSSWNKLDSISLPKPNLYTVVSSQPAFNFGDKAWFVGTTRINAVSQSEALALAQNNVHKSTSNGQKFAFGIGNFYICIYSGTSGPVMTLAKINPNGISPSAVNFN